MRVPKELMEVSRRDTRQGLQAREGYGRDRALDTGYLPWIALTCSQSDIAAGHSQRGVVQRGVSLT